MNSYNINPSYLNQRIPDNVLNRQLTSENYFITPNSVSLLYTENGSSLTRIEFTTPAMTNLIMNGNGIDNGNNYLTNKK